MFGLWLLEVAIPLLGRAPLVGEKAMSDFDCEGCGKAMGKESWYEGNGLCNICQPPDPMDSIFICNCGRPYYVWNSPAGPDECDSCYELRKGLGDV